VAKLRRVEHLPRGIDADHARRGAGDADGSGGGDAGPGADIEDEVAAFRRSNATR